MNLKTDEYINDLNNPLFRNYILNSNLYGNWNNNWNIAFENSKNTHYDCSIYNATEYAPQCDIELINNSTLLDNLGSFF